MKFIFFISLILSGCSSAFLSGGPREGKMTYAYVDESGTYTYSRENKKKNQLLISRSLIFDKKGSGSRLLEKTINVSRIGSIKHKNVRLLTIRPEASDYVVWIEGKKYTSKFRIDLKTKKMKLVTTGPEEKFNEVKMIPFPKAKYFCFFGQLPECLFYSNILANLSERNLERQDFYLIWDSFPHTKELLTGVGNKLFTPAFIKFDGQKDGFLRYILEVNGQEILYQFTKSFDLIKMVWVNQGIILAPPGQEIVED